MGEGRAGAAVALWAGDGGSGQRATAVRCLRRYAHMHTRLSTRTLPPNFRHTKSTRFLYLKVNR